ncbi:hypothetical protein LJB42_004668 [Komagataella kurtzmanii]|nr:hypothetical protein LJB42_004668 [Komagataella kurtzmanii]
MPLDESDSVELLGSNYLSQSPAISLPLVLAVLMSCLSSVQYGYHMSELNAPESVYTCRTPITGPHEDYSKSWFGRHGYKSCIPLDVNQIGIVTSIFTIGGLLGSLYAGQLSENIGRKKMFTANSLVFAVGSLLESLSNTYGQLLCGRLLSGIGAGSGIVVSALYINEVSPIELRGLLGSMNQIFINVGILLTQLLAIGWTNDEQWRYILVTAFVIAIVNFVASNFALESPKWLAIESSNSREALAVLFQLRNGDLNRCQEEITSWEREKLSRERYIAENPEQANLSLISYLTSSKYSRSRRNVTFIMVGQQFCGINSIIFYGVKVLVSLFPAGALAINCLISLLNLTVTGTASLFMDRWGRKPLLLTSATLMGISSVAMAVGIINSVAVLSVLATFLYVGSFAVAIGPIPFLIVSEISQQEVRGIAQSWGTAANWIATFAIGYLFPIVNEYIGGYVYFIFAFMCFLFGYYTYLYIPETKGKGTYKEVWGDEIR